MLVDKLKNSQSVNSKNVIDVDNPVVVATASIIANMKSCDKEKSYEGENLSSPFSGITSKRETINSFLNKKSDKGTGLSNNSNNR